MINKLKWTRLFQIIAVLVVLSLSILATSCGGGGGSPSSDTKTYTIFVYGHGDHNLTGSLDTDLAKMAAATLNDNINIIVAADWNAASAKKDGSGNYPSGTEWYKVTGGGNKTLLKTDAEQNLDEPATLTAAVSYAFKNYPAAHYGIILWDHGGAWDSGFGGDTNNDTIPSDQLKGLTNIEIKDAVIAGLADAGITGTQPLDFFAFDTCLLGAAEVTQLIKDIAKVFIANAELDFGSGWNYTQTFTNLAANTTISSTMTPAELAAMEISAWDDLHRTVTFSDMFLRSHMALDSSKVDAFTAAMKALVDAISATKTGGVLPDNAMQLSLAAALSIPSYGMTAGQGSDTTKYRDLGQFLKALATASLGDISTNAGLALDALTAMQIGRNYGTLRDPLTTYQLGFNIGLPEINSLTTEIITSYTEKAAAWNTATGWGGFLSDLMNSKSSELPDGSFTVNTATGTFTINDTAANRAATFGTMEALANDPNEPSKQVNFGATHFGRVMTSTLPNTYTMAWDGKAWTAGDQVTAVLPWIYLNSELGAMATGANNLLAAYGEVVISGSDGAMAVLIFKAGESAADAIAYRSPDGDWDSQKIDEFVQDNPGATFKPALLRVNPAEGESELVFLDNTAVALPASGGVTMSQADASSKTGISDFTLFFTCENAWGNKFEGSGAVTLP